MSTRTRARVWPHAGRLASIAATEESLFAQTLGTEETVSPQRIRKALAALV